MHLLIPYVHLPYHNDPLLDEFTYGDVRARAQKLKSLSNTFANYDGEVRTSAV